MQRAVSKITTAIAILFVSIMGGWLVGALAPFFLQNSTGGYSSVFLQNIATNGILQMFFVGVGLLVGLVAGFKAVDGGTR